MRLRTKLALAFALVAALPLLALTVPTRRSMGEAYDDALSARLDSAARAAELLVADATREAERAAADAAASQPVQDLAEALHERAAEPAQVLPLAEALMTSRGIDLLELLDDQGRVLSSGHLPARAGDPDPEALALARRGAGAGLLTVEVRADAGIERRLAVAAARPVDLGTTRLWVLAGRQLGPAWAQHLAELTGAEVRVRGPEGTEARSGFALPPRARFRARELAVPEQVAPGAPQAALTLRLSAEALAAAEARLYRSTLLLIGLALAFAGLLGAVLALRITRPVDALAEGAKALARGELGHRVQAEAAGEVGELVRTFNAMASDLKNATERAAVAERVAAWQEVARRLAHEIKNPLTPIRMSVETLQQAYAKRHAKFEELFLEGTRAIVEEVDRLKRIVDEFSRFARLPRPQLAKLDLGELVGQVAALYAGTGLQLTRELAPDLPRVLADRDQLTQVLVNLLTNAEQAMGGRGACTVRAVRAASGEVVLEVEDAGPGIPEAERGKIFEPYFTTKAGGSGLGLAIVQRIVSEHGGRIEVGAAPGGGARFRVILPAAAAV